jgi:hypothetical protein
MQPDEPAVPPPSAVRPVRPPRPEETPPRGSIWSVIIAGIVGLVLFGGLSLMFLPIVGVALAVPVIVGVFFLIAVLHYVIWGHWLRDAIHREVEEEDRIAEEERQKKF